MQRRAQQCVVCLVEKEHTLVPPHHGVAADGSEACRLGVSRTSPCFDGHRFCTDCWTEFLLRHGSEQPPKGRHGSPRSKRLLCPVCRGAIGVPDVWRLRLDLPATFGALSPKASRSSASGARCRVRQGQSHRAGPSQRHASARVSNVSVLSAPLPTEADGAAVSGRLTLQEEGSPQFWAIRRAGPGAAWAASRSAVTGPPVVRDGLVPDIDTWIVPPFWQTAAWWFELWKLALTVLLFLTGYIFALLAAAEVAASIVGDASHPGVATLLVDVWDFAAALATEFAHRDGYSD